MLCAACGECTTPEVNSRQFKSKEKRLNTEGTEGTENTENTEKKRTSKESVEGKKEREKPMQTKQWRARENSDNVTSKV
jgi:hypothetical protein